MTDDDVERARELYFNAFSSALQRGDALAVTYIACQYARFMASKCQDVQRAHEIFNQAIANPKCANKVLYLSYVNLAKASSLQGQTQSPKQIFERALQQLEEFQKAGDTERFEDLQDICHYYLAYLEEESEGGGAPVSGLREVKAVKAKMQEKGFLVEKFNSKSILARVADG